MNPSATGMKLATVGRALALGFLLALPVWAAVAVKTPGEYELKAAFLYNFISFTEWPDTAFENVSSPIIIGVFGKDPFGSTLEAVMTGERLKNRPLIVWRINRIEDITRCHILFISSSESNHMDDILRRLNTQPVLTVSDMPGFAEAGGAVAFSTAERIRLTINPAAVQSAHLTLSAKLLRLARLVNQTVSRQ